MIISEKMIVNRDKALVKMLTECTPIYNAGISFLRKELFAARDENRKPVYDIIKLDNHIKSQDCWKKSDIDINIKQYCIRTVWSTWQTYLKTVRAYWKDKSKFKSIPKPPNVLTDGKAPKVIVNHSRFRHRNIEENSLHLPKTHYKVQLPDYVKLDSVRCIIITQYYHKIKLSISYDDNFQHKSYNLNEDIALGIDLGVNNLLSMTTNGHNGVSLSWLVRGGPVKSINQYYNKMLSQKKSILSIVNHKHTSMETDRLSMKRALKLEHEFHNIVNTVINLCIEHCIGTIVIGHNNGWKQRSNMSKKTNQNFVSIPFNKLIDMIQYKSSRVGIKVILVNESYTSKCDHLVGESMTHHDVYLGKRVKRGLFKSSTGKLLNADINGAIGILRKANVVTDADLFGLRDRGDVVSPVVLNCKYCRKLQS